MECSGLIEYVIALEQWQEQNLTFGDSFLKSNAKIDLATAVDDSDINSSLCYKNRAYIFPFQFAVGILGNLLTIGVLNRKSARSLTNYFLSVMAAADICFFLSICPSSMIVFYPMRDSVRFKQLYYFAYPYLLMLANASSAMSFWSAAGVTAERLTAIRHPLKVRLIFKQSRMIRWTFLLLLLSLFLSSFKVIQIYENYNFINKTISLHNLEALGILLFLLIMLLTPIFLITVFNVMLKIEISKTQNHQLYKHNVTDPVRRSFQRRQRKITVTVMLATVSTVILNVPSMCMGLYKAVGNFRGTELNASSSDILVPVGNMLCAMDKCLHFFLYCWLSSKFREGLTQILACNKKRRLYDSIEAGS